MSPSTLIHPQSLMGTGLESSDGSRQYSSALGLSLAWLSDSIVEDSDLRFAELSLEAILSHGGADVLRLAAHEQMLARQEFYM